MAALRVQGNFMFDAATHRDFLGAILGTGIERSKVGDIILVGETGAQILVAAELLEHFEQSLTQACTPCSHTTSTSGACFMCRFAVLQICRFAVL